jgi:hypothetical protein
MEREQAVAREVHESTSLGMVDDLVGRCLHGAAGGRVADGDAVSRLLVDLRDGLAPLPAFQARESVWREYLARMLTAMARERRWHLDRQVAREASDAVTEVLPPTFEEYLANADNFGTWTNITHWIRNDDPQVTQCHEELISASQLVQRVLRLYNDRATLGRDDNWGDLNARQLTSDEAITIRIGTLTQQCEERFIGLRRRCPDGADYLQRQLAFSAAFYGRGDDHWNQPTPAK